MDDAPTILLGSPSSPIESRRDQIIRTPKCGFRGQLTAATAQLYVAPSATTPTGSTQGALLKSIIVCNTDTVARTYTLTIVEAAGAVADNRAIFKDATIAAKTTHEFMYDDEDFPLDSGETINGLADLTLKVTVRIGVVELTS